jgi:hypothetical protein
MIQAGHGVAIREDESREGLLRASGPGGRNAKALRPISEPPRRPPPESSSSP